MRNFRVLSSKKILLWLLLAVSSLPLHLFYNSTVFSSVQANSYDVFSVNESYLSQSGPGNVDTVDEGAYNVDHPDAYNISVELHQKLLNSTLQNLSNIDCINAYAQIFQTTQGNLLLVTNTSSNRLIEEELVFSPANHAQGCTDAYHWICLDADNDIQDTDLCGTTACPNLIPGIRANPSNWSVFHDQIQYCLSEPVDQNCKLQFNVRFAVIVIIFNAIKTAIMAYSAFGVSRTPLMTVGDAITSFLEREDSAARGRCLLSRSNVERLQFLEPQPIPFSSKRKRWYAAASAGRWFFSCLL
jgi:hypothetical protein